MEIVNFDEIKNELLQNMQRQMLIPIIGAGFTCGCKSKNGNVPSGTEYKDFMIKEISENLETNDDEICKLKSEKFSTIAEIYYSIIDESKRKEYLENNFSRVKIDNYKKDFLNIDWPYIYTINLDDGIENNSSYNCVVLPYKDIYENIFEKYKCVIKIHGDIKYLTTYKDEEGILTQKQYLNSLKSNKVILSKLEHDHFYQNIIYIGCSLDDEIDIKSLANYDKQYECSTSRYFCAIKEPSSIDKIKYETFGITHYIIFNSYEDIYKKIFDLWNESKKISENDLDYFKILDSHTLDFDYDENKPYLLQGKGLVRNNNITLPCFFVSREITKTLIRNFNKYTIQVLIGNGCSGKSYALADVANKIKDYDVYLFESKDRLNNEAFEILLEKNNSVLLFDSKTLDQYQIERIIDMRNNLKRKKSNIIIAADKNDQGLNRVLSLKELKNEIKKGEILQLEIKNRFSLDESNEVNKLLSIANLGIFEIRKTIVDNIISIGKKLVEKNKYINYNVKTDDIYQISALIMLAIEHKIYSQRVTQFDLNKEFELHVKCSTPLIEKEMVWNFEKSPRDNSPYKYVVEADYWLRLKLKQYAQIEKNQKNIADAFVYIVSKILKIYGEPQLYYNDNSIYKDYVLFDNINKIFSTKNNNEMTLIRGIYEKLNPLLSVDPNFKHQYAKCYIQSAIKEKDINKKLRYLNEANRNICESLEIFKARYEDKENDKLLISIAHAKYTQAVICCHQCFINNYKNAEQNIRCIDLLHVAMTSDYNSFEYVQNDTINYNNVVQNTITYFTINQDTLDKNSIKKVEELFNMERVGFVKKKGNIKRR